MHHHQRVFNKRLTPFLPTHSTRAQLSVITWYYLRCDLVSLSCWLLWKCNCIVSLPSSTQPPSLTSYLHISPPPPPSFSPEQRKVKRWKWWLWWSSGRTIKQCSGLDYSLTWLELDLSRDSLGSIIHTASPALLPQLEISSKQNFATASSGLGRMYNI